MNHKSIEVIKELEYKGYKCVIKRNLILKALLGYVKLPKGHRYYGVSIEKIPVECHGDLTYGEIENDNYVIGFDCAHIFDFDFENKRGISKNAFKYPIGIPNKSENYVIEDLKRIVDQL